MKTIIHVAEAFGGGIIEFILQIARHQPEYHHIIIYGQRGVDIEAVRKHFPDNTDFIAWPFAQREIHPVKDWRALRHLHRMVKKLSKQYAVQAIHLHSSKAGFLGRFALKGVVPKNQLIYTPNGLAFARRDVSVWKQRLFVVLEYLANAYAGRVIACGASEAALMRAKGIPAAYINNGTAFRPEEFQVLKKLRKSPGEKIIITVGRASIQKHPALFNRIARHFENDPMVRFIWVGGGELGHELQGSNIEVTGWLPKSEVISYLKQADIYLSTALWEGLPFAVLEAMMCEKPLLLHHCVGNEDLVKDGVNGFLFKSAEEAVEKLNILLSAPEQELHCMGMASRRFCEEEFNAEKMAALYRKAYEGTF